MTRIFAVGFALLLCACGSEILGVSGAPSEDAGGDASADAAPDARTGGASDGGLLDSSSDAGVDASRPCTTGIVTLSENGDAAANVFGIALDDANVYWSTDEGIMKVSKCGGPTTTLVPGVGSSLAVHGTSIYFSNEIALLKVPVGGGMVTTLASLPDGSSPGVSGIAVDATHVYTTIYAAAPPGSFGYVLTRLVSVPLGGGALVTLAAGESSAYNNSVALDATHVYSASYGPRAGEGSIVAMPLGGGTATTLASALFYPTDIARKGATLYWMTGGVSNMPLGGGAVTTVFSLPPKGAASSGASSFAVDDDSVYVTTEVTRTSTSANTGMVLKAPLAGGNPTTLATKQVGPQFIAVDATSVYWATIQDGSTGFGGAIQKLTPK